MDEGRRFLRYVTPGLVYGIETIFFLWLTCPTWLEGFIKTVVNLDKDGLVGPVLASVLAFGVLGYIFSTTFHVLHLSSNKTCNEEDRVLDHRVIAGCLKGKDVDNPGTAMAISYAHWYKQINLGNIHGDANKKVQSLGDQAFGLGAAFMASSFAAISTLVICATELNLEALPIYRLALMLFIWGWITYWFGSAYERVGKIAQETYENILKDALSTKQKPPCSWRSYRCQRSVNDIDKL